MSALLASSNITLYPLAKRKMAPFPAFLSTVTFPQEPYHMISPCALPPPDTGWVLFCHRLREHYFSSQPVDSTSHLRDNLEYKVERIPENTKQAGSLRSLGIQAATRMAGAYTRTSRTGAFLFYVYMLFPPSIISRLMIHERTQ